MTSFYDDSGSLRPATIVSFENLILTKSDSLKKDFAILAGKNNSNHKSVKKQIGLNDETGYISFVSLGESKDDKQGDASLNELISSFVIGTKVNVTATTKGKGFAGVVKRWNFAGGPRTHGQSDRERAPGSIGSRAIPGRVFKGKKMAGHMGVKKKTIKNLRVLDVDTENKYILVSGSVPGPRGSVVIISKND